MDQIPASTKSLSTTSRSLLSLSMHYEDNQDNHSVRVKI